MDQLMDDYHIIAPDLTGHGSDKGRFESAQKEAAEITDWLIQNQMKELALVFGVSLGSVIAMNVISHEELLHTHCAVMEGASLTRVHGVEWLFRAMFREMKKRPETIANLYASMPKLDADVQQKLLDTMANTDKEELFNLVHACNSYPFEECSLSPELQRHLFLNSGTEILIWSVRKQLENIITKRGSQQEKAMDTAATCLRTGRTMQRCCAAIWKRKNETAALANVGGFG